MDNLFDKYISKDLSELAGLEIIGTIPVENKLIDEFLAEELAAFSTPADQEHQREEWYTRFFKWIKIKAKSKDGEVTLNVHLHVDQ